LIGATGAVSWPFEPKVIGTAPPTEVPSIVRCDSQASAPTLR
jgi:hypothetical protein